MSNNIREIRVELVMSPNEVREKFPIGRVINRDGVNYKVTGYFDSASSISFASYPGYIATIIE